MKKGKKSFSDGLESLFHQTLYEDNLQDNPSVLNAGEEQKTEVKTTTRKTTKKKTNTKAKKNNRKSFSNDLELFFKESIEESIEGTEVTEIKKNIIRKGKRKAIGIDVLLQRTVEENQSLLISNEKIKPSTKRVTFVLDVDKIEQLKTIAREEKKRMRSVVSELIERYIEGRTDEPLETEPKPKRKKTTKKAKTPKKTTPRKKK